MIPPALDPRRWLPEAQRGRAAVRSMPTATTATTAATTTAVPAAPATPTTSRRATAATATGLPTAPPAVVSEPRGLTLRQKLLVAALHLGGTCRVAELVVRAWRLYPETFALAGHPEHPDSNRVQAKLCGVDGLCGLGWLERVDVGTYRVTRKGRLVARDLAGGR